MITPVILQYGKGDFQENSPFLHHSLGNIGQAQSKCYHQFVGIDKPFLQSCKKGKMSAIVYFGLLPDNLHEALNMQGYDYCGKIDEFDKPEIS